MIKKLPILLVVPIAALPLAFIYDSRRAQPPASVPLVIATAGADIDYSRHVEQLKKKLPSPDFTIVVQPPFVVIGDEPAEAVKEHSERTVKWAVDKLKQDYFSKDPKEILDIWL